jgi:hypothetical protein
MTDVAGPAGEAGANRHHPAAGRGLSLPTRGQVRLMVCTRFGA